MSEAKETKQKVPRKSRARPFLIQEMVTNPNDGLDQPFWQDLNLEVQINSTGDALRVLKQIKRDGRFRIIQVKDVKQLTHKQVSVVEAVLEDA